MDVIRKAGERMQQSVLETVGSASKTELELTLLARLAMTDDIKNNSERLLSAMQKVLPHDARLTAAFVNATHPAEVVAQAMKGFAESAEQWPETGMRDYVACLFRTGYSVYRTLCRTEKAYMENAAIHFLAPMKEKKELMISRVDMDSARNRAEKHEECRPEADRATLAFQHQKEIVEEEIRNLERKLSLICAAIATQASFVHLFEKFSTVDDHVEYLENSLAAMKELQEISRRQLKSGTMSAEKMNGHAVKQPVVIVTATSKTH